MRLAPQDDVAVALRDIGPGETVHLSDTQLTLVQFVPAGHKFALRDIAAGEAVRKYGWIVGYATTAIPAGSHVHTQNLVAGAVNRDAYTAGPSQEATWELPTRTFHGYRRRHGHAGTRNCVLVISTVNCSADVAHAIVERLRPRVAEDFRNVDGIYPITHKGGCGIPIGGASYEVLRRCLSGIAAHPNVGGVLIIGLGCEVMQADVIARDAAASGVPTRMLGIQEVGGVGPAIRRGIDEVTALLQEVNLARRSSVPLSDLIVGTECGGSDAYSGITANPLLGYVGDMFVRAGAAWVLGESPETYGADHLLRARAANAAVAHRLDAVMRWWEQYTARHDASIDNNPAPGNKEGGITTVYEKALGAVAKAGNTVLKDVLEYAQPVRSSGLSFMDTPGMDDVSVTGLVAGGCNLIAFTTGRGSCLAFGPVPIVKIASTSDLFERMPDDMDFDAGRILRTVPMEVAARQLAGLIVSVASGQRTCGEQQALGDHTFAPWDLGPTL